MADPDSDSATEECNGSLALHSANASSLEGPQAYVVFVEVLTEGLSCL